MGWPNDTAVHRAVAAWNDFTAPPEDEGDDLEGEHWERWARGLAVAMLTAAGPPELVGTSDAARILGVEPSNLGSLAGLPEPLYAPDLDPPRYVRAGRLYDASEIRALAATPRDERVARPEATHCPRGHELTPENMNASGRCKVCERDRVAAYRASKRAAA